MKALNFLIIVLISFYARNGNAKYTINMGLGIASDKGNQFESSKNIQNFYSTEINFRTGANSSFFLNVGYFYLSSTAPISSSETSLLVNSTPYAGIFFCALKDDMVCVGINYSPYGQSHYSQSNTKASESWLVNTSFAVIAIRPKISFKTSLYFNLNFISMNYSQRKINEGTSALTSADNFTRNIILPTVGISYDF